MFIQLIASPPSLILLVILIIILIIWFLLKRKPKNGPKEENVIWKAPLNGKFYYDEIAEEDDFMFFYREGTTTPDISNLENTMKVKFPNLIVKSCDCDPLLRRYSNLALVELQKHGDTINGVPKGRDHGDPTPFPFPGAEWVIPTYITRSEPTFNAVNKICYDAKATFQSPDKDIKLDNTPLRQGIYNTRQDVTYNRNVIDVLDKKSLSGSAPDTIEIGVLDTGFDYQVLDDQELSTNLNLTSSFDKDFHENPGQCERLNFIETSLDFPNSYKYNVPQDDDDGRHGTVVTALILNELRDVPVKMIPKKVLNQEGKGNLFDFLCAIAGSNQPDFYNVSLGFYADPTTFPKELLSKYMNGTDSWFFVAAGNKVESNDSLLEPNERDLDKRKYKFYPACLQDVPKMIVVTSVVKNNSAYDVCPNQNYSENYVHLGVQTTNENSCDITPSGFGGNGSSFATPIALGKILKHLYKNNSGRSPLATILPSDRDGIWAGAQQLLQNVDSLPEKKILLNRVIDSAGNNQ